MGKAVIFSLQYSIQVDYILEKKECKLFSFQKGILSP